MRLPIFIAFLIFYSSASYAQLPGNFNLVSNGSFNLSPDLIFLDTNFENSACWIKANRSSPTVLTSTTHAYWDTSLATLVVDASGIMGGFIINNPLFRYSRSQDKIIDTLTVADNRAYAHNRLLEPLVAGQTYRFSMRLWNMNYSVKALQQMAATTGFIHQWVRNIGVYFSNTKSTFYGSSQRINVTPQLNFRNYDGTKTDTLEFLEVSGLYTAVGGEQYIIIGNFDAKKDFTINTSNWLPTWSDTLLMSTYQTVTGVALVRDTTLPVMELTDFSLGNDTVICPATPVTLGGQPYFFRYLWNTGDTTRFISTSTPGDYWCNVDFGCGRFTDTIHIALPPPLPVFNIRDTTICLGKTLQVQAPAGYVHYTWSNGATTVSTTLNAPGNYWVRITDACGLFTADTFMVSPTGTTIPGININTVPPSILCEGTAITFITNNTGAGSNPQYQWYKNGTLLAGANGTTYRDSLLSDGDTLSVRMYSSAACPLTQPTWSNKVGVTVYPVVTPQVSLSVSPGTTIAPGQIVTFTTAPTNQGMTPNYQWYLNGMLVPNTNGSTWTTSALHDGDRVSVRLESSIPCPSTPFATSNELQFRVGSNAVGSIHGNIAVSVYPNPVRDVVNISFSVPVKHAGCRLYDSFGRMVAETNSEDESAISLDISGFSSGLYLYRVVIDGEVISGKVRKE